MFRAYVMIPEVCESDKSVSFPSLSCKFKSFYFSLDSQIAVSSCFYKADRDSLFMTFK